MRLVGSAVAVAVLGLSLGTVPTNARAAFPPEALTPKGLADHRHQSLPGAALGPAAPTLASAPTCDSKWNIVASQNSHAPNDPTMDNELNGVSAISATDGWAVGDFVITYPNSPSGVIRQPMAEHWDGTGFTLPTAQPLPESSQGGDSVLTSVAMIATNDVWAVGLSKINNYTGSASVVLVEHYDGSAWHVITGLINPTGSNALFGVKALAANDVWAVGRSQDSPSVARTLIEHYDGISWTIVPSPNPFGPNAFNQLSDVLPLSRTDVWAVGTGLSNVTGAFPEGFIEHWDGTAWTEPPYVTRGLPPTNTATSYNDVAGVKGDIWIVGWMSTGSTAQPFTQHYDGQAWTITNAPSPGQDDQLIGVRYTATNDVWAFGSAAYSRVGTPYEVAHTLIEHWDGDHWATVASPNPGANQVLFDGALAGPNLLLTVGFSQPTPDRATLAAALCEPPPAITGVLPTQGPAGGGNAVTVYGSGLSFPRSVTFGNVPASSYTATSDSQITAIAPPQPIGTSVVVTVTTMGGSPSVFGNDQYTYVGSPGQWQNHGGVLASSPTAVASGSAHVGAFVRGTDNQLWHLDASRNLWEPLPGLTVTSDAAAISTGTDSFAVFVRGSDNALWRNDFNGTAWAGWVKLGGILAGAPAVASPSAGTLDVFVEGTDRRLYFDNITSTGSVWYGPGGILAAPPSAVRASNGNVEALVMGADGQLWRWNGNIYDPYGRWVAAGGRLAAPPALTSSYDGTIDALVEGTDGHLWHWSANTFSGGSWELIGGRLGAAPVATSWGNGRLDVAVRGTDGALWHAWRSPRGGWSWEDLGGVIVGPPAIVAKDLYLLDIFVRGSDNRLWHLPFN
jgi:IPT/TIG domain-containing protein